MLISKADFKPYVKFTDNINDNDVNPYIKQAERFLPVFSDNIYHQLRLLERVEYTDFNFTGVSLGYVVEYQQQLFKALETTSTVPAINNAAYVLLDIETFFEFAIKPFLVYKAYSLMMPDFGVKVTSAGLVQTIDSNTFEHVSDKRRAEFTGNITSNLQFYESEVERYAKLYGYLPTTTECGTSTYTNDTAGIYVVGNNRKRGKCCDRDWRSYRDLD